MATVHFREEQRFSPVIIITSVIALVVGLALLLVPSARLAGVIVAWTAGATALLFTVLKPDTEVRDDGLYVRLFPLPLRRIAVEDFASFQDRTYRPILQYDGRRLRRGVSGEAYNLH